LEPLIEDQKRIVFVSEKLQFSLAFLLQSMFWCAYPGGELSKLIQTDLDIKIHMLELIEGVSFMHSDAKMVHLGISPENIYITPSGKWKVSTILILSSPVYHSVFSP
jgi:SCY1-like protein 2